MDSFDKWRGNPPTSGYGRDIQSWHSETERLRKCWDDAQADLHAEVERLNAEINRLEQYIINQHKERRQG